MQQQNNHEPMTDNEKEYAQKFYRCAEILGFTPAHFGMLLYTNLALDPALECVRFLRAIPHFQRFRGRQLVNRLHQAIVRADATICNELGINVALLEAATEAQNYRIETEGMADYRETIKRIHLRNGYAYPDAYVNVVVASSVCDIIDRYERENILDLLRSPSIVVDSDGGKMKVFKGTGNATAWFERMSCHGIQAALDNIRHEFDRVPELIAGFDITATEHEVVKNKSRGLVQLVLDIDVMVDTLLAAYESKHVKAS